MLRTLAAALVALLLAAGPLAAWGAEPARGRPTPPHEGAMIADILLVRPLGLAAVAVGLAAYIPLSIIYALGNQPDDEIRETFLTRPQEFTFKRRLGEFKYD